PTANAAPPTAVSHRPTAISGLPSQPRRSQTLTGARYVVRFNSLMDQPPCKFGGRPRAELADGITYAKRLVSTIGKVLLERQRLQAFRKVGGFRRVLTDVPIAIVYVGHGTAVAPAGRRLLTLKAELDSQGTGWFMTLEPVRATEDVLWRIKGE